MSFAITLDTGALIAIERRHDRMARVMRVAIAMASPVIVPAVVLAEWWRGQPNALTARLLRGVTHEPMGEALAKSAGAALASVSSATTIDAIVMASAARRGGVVYTSDVEDLERLRRHFPEVRVLHA